MAEIKNYVDEVPNADNSVDLGSSTKRFKDLWLAGLIQAGEYKSSDGSSGWTGTFTNGDGATVTVKNGLITSVV